MIKPFRADFQLEIFRKELDQQGLQVAEQQETSLKSRKKLAEATKGRKRRIDASKPLLPSKASGSLHSAKL